MTGGSFPWQLHQSECNSPDDEDMAKDSTPCFIEETAQTACCPYECIPRDYTPRVFDAGVFAGRQEIQHTGTLLNMQQMDVRFCSRVPSAGLPQLIHVSDHVV